MALEPVVLDFEYYPDPTVGRPVFFGKIFIGTADTDAEIVGNQLEVFARQESGDIVAIGQPILTGAGGIPLFQGSPVALLVNGNYSLKVLNKQDSQVYNVPNHFAASNSIITPAQEPLRFGSEVDSNNQLVLSSVTAVAGTNSVTVVVNGSTQRFGTDYTIPIADTIQLTFDVQDADEIDIQAYEQVSVGVTDASSVSYNPGGTGSVVTNVQAKLRESVSIEDFDPTAGTGSNDTAAALAALTAHTVVRFPKGATYLINNLAIPSNRTLIIDGTIKQIDGASNLDAILINSDTVGGNTNIKIQGTGTIDGNASGQTGAIFQLCVHFDNVSNSQVKDVTIKDNYVPISNPGGTLTAAALFENSTGSSVKNVWLLNNGREGIYFSECDHCTIDGLVNIGGADSWSSATMTGTGSVSHNTITNVYSFEAGASGVTLDTPHSAISNITVEDNTFQNGVNIGHAGRVSDYSTATNITVKNAGKSGTGGVDTFFGINIGGSSKKVSLSNFSIETSLDHGLNISSGADEILVSNGQIDNSGHHGTNVFDAKVKYSNVHVDNAVNDSFHIEQDALTAEAWLSNCESSNAGDFGITADGCTVYASNTKSIGDPLSDPNSGQIEGRQLILSADDTRGGETIVGSAGFTVVVTNGNVRSNSVITLEPSNAAGALAQPFIQTYADGSFTIEIAATGASGAFVRWRIV